MTPQEIAALAMAGYSKADIERMTAPPVTVESLTAKVAALEAQIAAKQSAAIVTAQVTDTQQTAAEIIAAATAAKERDVK